MSSSVFLSYRRRDAAGYARSLYDRLNARFPNRVFMDWSGIETGSNYVKSIHAAISSCRVLLAVIGKEWLNSAGPAGDRRLDDPDDLLRREIAEALGRDILVIPVLLEGAAMPAARDLPSDLAALTQRQAIELSDARWDHDCTRLLEIVARALDPHARNRTRRRLVVPGIAILAVAAAGIGYNALRRNPGTSKIAGGGQGNPSPAASVSTGNGSIDDLVKAADDLTKAGLAQLAANNAGAPASGYSPNIGFQAAGKWLVNVRSGVAGSMVLELKADHNFSISNATDALKLISDQIGSAGSWTFDVKTGRLVLLPGSSNLGLAIYIAGKDGNGFRATSPDGVQYSLTRQ
jgi:TIR domain